MCLPSVNSVTAPSAGSGKEADDANSHKMAMCLPSVNSVTASSAGSCAVKRRKQTELEKAQPTPAITSVACFFKYLLYILGILIGIGGDLELGVGVFCIGLILGFVARFLPQGGIKFHLFPNEKKQGTCRVTDNDGWSYFVRITDRRLVFCGIQYGRLLGYYLRLPYIARLLAILLCGVNIYPEIAIFILKRLQRSNIISFEVVADDINDYSVERDVFFGGQISLTIDNAEYYFKGSIKPICKWIEEQFRSRGRAIV